MATMTHPVTRFAEDSHHPAVRAGLVIVFWVSAALLVLAVHQSIDPISPTGGVAMKLAVIVAAAFGYMRLTARKATVDHALFVGITWLLLNIAIEVTTSQTLHTGWFELIGNPRTLSRDLILFAWVGAPALFARYSSTTGEPL